MKLFASLSEDLTTWVLRQPFFITGSSSFYGPRVNVSPKGLCDSHFTVLNPNQAAYIDRSGSGCETISHAYENGRLCLMFMSFGPAPRILRMFCKATVVEWDAPTFDSWIRKISQGKQEVFNGARAVIVCDIWQVQTSCGFGVPRVRKGIYAPDEENPFELGPADAETGKRDELSVFEARPTLEGYWGNRAKNNTIFEYQREKNTASLDGMPGLRSARRDAAQVMWWVDLKARTRRLLAQKEAVMIGVLLAILLYCAAKAVLIIV